MQRSIHGDLRYDLNNDTLAIRPSVAGRLSGLVKMTVAGDERVWTFADDHVWKDANGDERLEHHRKGVVCGTYKQGKAFMAMCEELGLTLDYGLFVPFSNGQRAHGRLTWPEPDEPTSDYLAAELKLMRWDLPTREELEAVLVEDDKERMKRRQGVL